jgi:hypothetical protein
METPRKPLNKYWCSVPHYLSDIRNISVLTFDPQLKKILTFSVKDRYQLNYFICIKDFNAETNTSLKLKKRHISIGVFVVYINTGSSVPGVPSKSRDLADENNKILTE